MDQPTNSCRVAAWFNNALFQTGRVLQPFKRASVDAVDEPTSCRGPAAERRAVRQTSQSRSGGLRGGALGNHRSEFAVGGTEGK